MTESRRRRRAVYISEVDRRLQEHGLPTSWEESEGAAAIAAERTRQVLEARSRNSSQSPDDVGKVLSEHRGRGQTPLSGNDQRLLDEIPPHWQPKS